MTPLFWPVIIIAILIVVLPIVLWLREEWLKRNDEWDGWL